MTQAGPPIRVSGGPVAGAPIQVGDTEMGAPVAVVGSGGAIEIERLRNVEATGAPTDSVLVKGPDGKWRPRPYEPVDAAISAHISDPTPHPSYDDMPSLRLLYENGLI